MEDHLAGDIDEQIRSLYNGLIGEDYLKRVCGEDNLDNVNSLELLVNTSEQSLLDVGDLLPNLQSLSLDNSVVLTIRDLGTCLRHLSQLSLNGCGLRDIDGIGAFSGLRILSLCDNLITDVSPLAMHENITGT